MRPLLKLLPLLLLAGCASLASRAADDYYLVFLRRPADAPALDRADLEQLQADHLANIRRLHDQDHLVAAGPFGDDTPLRGIFAFHTAVRAEVEREIATDPLIKAGRLTGDLHHWMGDPAAFRAVDSSVKFEPETYAMVIYSGKAAPAGVRRSHARYVGGLPNVALHAVFDDDSGLAAVLILTGTPEEARATADRDPLVRQGAARAEIHPWFTQRGVLRR